MSEAYRSFRVPQQRPDGKYSISNMYGAAFFIARGNTLVDVEPMGDLNGLTFVIGPRSNGFSEDLAAWSTNGLVPVQKFVASIYVVKSAMRALVAKSRLPTCR